MTALPAASRSRQMPLRAGALGVVLPLLASGVVMGAAPVARAAEAGDGSVKIRVVREVNANGRWDRVLEPGMRKVKVNLTDDAGTTISGTTGTDGTVTLSPASTALKGHKYRVQVMNPKPGVLYSAHASREGLLGGDPEYLSSTEEFVDLSGGHDAEVTTAFWNPADYCQKNATLVTACFRKDHKGGPADSDTRTLIKFPYNARGNRNQTTDLSDKATTGAVYGIGYSKQKKRIFSGAMARRGSAYGPGGQGAIYVTDPESGDTAPFTTVPGAGTTPHQMDTDMDLGFNPAVTKESLGDVEVSEDGKDLYTVNLKDRKLYRYDATQPTAAAPKASYPIPDPGCAAAGDWRPFGLGVQDGVVYVGGVCSGESSQKQGDMRAVIKTFDPAGGAFTGTVMDQPLHFPRETTDTIATGGCGGSTWYPWSDDWRNKQDGTKTCRGGRIGYPQPVLADIIVDTDGDLILGFRDRFADQSGMDITHRDATGSFLVRAMSGGDLNRACPGADGKFVMDGNGGCTNNSTVAGIKEFYPGDRRTTWHREAAFAGVALSKVEDTIASSGIDPIETTYVSGTLFVNRVGGGAAPGLGNVQNSSFGKGGAMADLEVLCDEAPIQIGNRVWYDVDKDGIQDPGEKPVPGVTVNLYDEDGAVVATTTTTSRGEYYFDSVKDGLKFNTKYTIKIDNPDDYAEGGPLYRWAVTQNDAGSNDFIDSDGKVPAGGEYPEHTITTGSAGQDNHTYDFGYNQPDGEVRILKVDADTKKPVAGAEFQLWRETNGEDDLQTGGDTPDTKVSAAITTGADGLAKRVRQPLGTYYWQETKAPAGYQLPDPAVFGPLELDFDNYRKGVQTTAEDPPIPFGEVRVLKVDAKSTRPVAGAEFQLWRETNGEDDLQTGGDTPDTKVNGVITTGADGLAKAVRQPLGTYYWQETKAPVGYRLPDPAIFGPLELDVDNYRGGVEVTAEDEPLETRVSGSVRVLKVDAKTKKPLAGADFQLWRETNGTAGLQRTGTADTKVGATRTTDGKGLITVSVPLGTYYWQETKAPSRYRLPRPAVFGPLVLTRENAGAGVSATAENQPVPPKPGRIVLLKKDAETRKALPGAVFQIWRETNGRPGLQRTGTRRDTQVGSGCATDLRGECRFTVPNGMYYLYETAVPEGYRLPEKRVSGPYRITEKTKRIEATLYNPRDDADKK
ncbi:SpaA isopeptide-forming pilin-related protein [Actinomycetota bacterium Odt1-20B]